jgi:hypothetical protein
VDSTEYYAANTHTQSKNGMIFPSADDTVVWYAGHVSKCELQTISKARDKEDAKLTPT